MKKCYGKKHPYLEKCHEGYRHGMQCRCVEKCYRAYIERLIEKEGDEDVNGTKLSRTQGDYSERGK